MIPENITYLEISLDNLVHNLKQIKNKISNDTTIIAVIKDNAYGCGAPLIAKSLENENVNFFIVARIDEARELRAHSISSPILVLGDCSPIDMAWAYDNSIRLTINSMETLEIYKTTDTRAIIHLNIDTGMSRMGISLSQLDNAIDYIKNNNKLSIEGVFTHFACADEPETKTVDKQTSFFQKAVKTIKLKGLSPALIHSSNSAAILRFGNNQTNAIRPGIVLYGCMPDPIQIFPIQTIPVISLKSCIAKIKKITAGTRVSYGGIYTAKSNTFLATIPIGYAHGLPRQLSNKGQVLIHGKRFPIVGRVTMDYIMVDLGPETKIAIGDEVVAIGIQKNDCIHPDEIAILCDTIGYEILCGLNSRLDRIYIKNNKIVSHEKNMLQ